MIKECLSCGSGDFIDGVELLDSGEAARGIATLRLKANPSAILFKDRRYSKVEVLVCGDCGFVHSFAADLNVLLEARAARDGVPFVKKEVKVQWKSEE
ncbi:MAG: hypothetical protein ACSHX6_15115 [Akkermansiaceae bacterium]